MSIANQPAFPVPSALIPRPGYAHAESPLTNTHEYGEGPQVGMTYLQWLIGMAMQGLVAKPGTDYSTSDLAADAVLVAYATIAAQEKQAAAGQ